MAEEQQQNQQNNEIEELKKKMEQCEKTRDEYLDGWKRAKADLINYKKDETQRMEQFFKFSNEQILSEFIAVLDSLEMGLKMMKKDDMEQTGMNIIKGQIEDLLKRYGLEKIKIQAGEIFDPKNQEAVSEEESEKPVNTIIEEISAGYFLNGKVLRPAKIKIAKGQPNENLESKI